MFLIIFISLLAFTLLWILFAPVILRVDTKRELFRLGLPGIISARIIPSASGGLFHFRICVFFIPFRFNPFRTRQGGRRKEKLPAEKKEKKPKRKGFSNVIKNMGTGRYFLRAIRIKRLHLDIDTDDFMLNAWMVPVFSALNSGRVIMQVNFEGRASLDLDLRTRLSSLLWAMIITKYYHKYHS